MFCSLTYLLLALAESSGAPYGDGSFGWLHYADWVFTTPLLLVRVSERSEGRWGVGWAGERAPHPHHPFPHLPSAASAATHPSSLLRR